MSTGNYSGGGEGWGGYSSDAMSSAMSQSDAQAAESDAQGGWPGAGDTVSQAISNINSIDAINVNSAISSNSDIAKNSIAELKSSFLKGQLLSTAIGFNPITMIASVAKLAYNVNKIKSAIADKFGDDIAEKSMNDAISMGGSKPGVSPEGEGEKEWQQVLSEYSATGGNLSPEQIEQVKVEIQREQDTQAIIQKIGTKPAGRAGNDWQQQFDSHMTMVEESGRDLFDSAQGMGVPQWWTDYVQGRGDRVDKIFEDPTASVVQGTNDGAASATPTKQGTIAEGEVSMEKNKSEYNSIMKASIAAINDADTNIEYNHTLADLSGIQMDEKEKKLLYDQKEIAIDRAITEIEDTFSFEGESIVAQQIQNLGANALGGTIGQSFVKRWQGREAAAKTGALQDIESSYLAAERQGIDVQKQRQIDIWGKEFDVDKTQAEFNLEKARSSALLGSDWGKSTYGTETNVEQAALDRALQERMGTSRIEAGLATTQMEKDYAGEANKWSAAGGIAGAVAGSDWFGKAISSIW